MNARMLLRFGALTLLIAAAPVAAKIVQFEVPAVEGTHDIDLGIQSDRVISITVGLVGTAQDHFYHCHNEYPGGTVDYDHWESTHFWIEVQSNGASTGEDWYSPDGEFNAEVPLPVYSLYEHVLFADGTGTLTFDGWVELFPPYLYDCGMVEPGFVNFAEMLLLTVEFDGTVATETFSWGSIKALYRHAAR